MMNIMAADMLTGGGGERPTPPPPSFLKFLEQAKTVSHVRSTARNLMYGLGSLSCHTQVFPNFSITDKKNQETDHITPTAHACTDS